MNNSGWIKLHRKFTKWGWYQSPNMVLLFLHLLLSTNHEKKEWNGIAIGKGQVVTGRKQLSKQTGLSEQQIRTCIKRLKSTSEITTKTTNKYTIITITNWEDYQNKEKISTKKSTKSVTNNQPTTNQQATTNKKYKNYKKIKKNSKAIALQGKFNHLGAEIIKAFEEINPACKKYYNNNTQRTACDDLIKEYTLEQVLKVISILPQTNKLTFIPTVTTPHQLFQKWTSLRDNLIKIKNKPLKDKVAFT